MTPQALAELHARAYPRPWSSASFTSALAQSGAVLIADPICFALGRVIFDEAELLHIATDPAHQRAGHAGRALAAFEQQAKALGAQRAFLEVAASDSAARALYVNAGWSQDGLRRGYYPDGKGGFDDAILMSKTL